MIKAGKKTNYPTKMPLIDLLLLKTNRQQVQERERDKRATFTNKRF